MQMIKGNKHVFGLSTRLNKFQGRKYEYYLKILSQFKKNLFSSHKEMGFVNLSDSFCWPDENMRAGPQKKENRYAKSLLLI